MGTGLRGTGRIKWGKRKGNGKVTLVIWAAGHISFGEL